MWNLLLETESSIGDELTTNLRIFQRHTWFVEVEDINNTITRQESIPRVNTLREKCPDTEFFLVRIFPHSD